MEYLPNSWEMESAAFSPKQLANGEYTKHFGNGELTKKKIDKWRTYREVI